MRLRYERAERKQPPFGSNVYSTLRKEVGEGTDPRVCVELCKVALYNWSLSLMEGELAGAGQDGLMTTDEAMVTWKDALDFWEEQCRLQPK